MIKLIQEDITLESVLTSDKTVFTVVLLAVIFSIFFFIMTVLYMNPPLNLKIVSPKPPEANVLETLCDKTNSRLSLEQSASSSMPDEIVESSEEISLPDTSEVEVTDEANECSSCPLQQMKQENREAADIEALISLRKALKCKQLNKLDKARMLFQHAISISPNHPEILVHYGEFLESDGDFVNADYFYLKAIMVGTTESSQALTNHNRILPVVNEIDLEELKRIDSKRRMLFCLDDKDPTFRRLKKEMYFQHIYHTVALEGNTMTLAETRTILETKMSIHGKSIVEHNEILGLDEALRFLNQTLSSKEVIAVSDILDIHKRVMGFVDPTSAGSLRTTQVFVAYHIPPPASELEVMMAEFVAVLQSPPITNMHPLHIAAFAHYKLVFIHPFLDGNGRTARLLMNLILIRYGYPPIIIKKEDRSQYHNLLQIANEGDRRPFYRFIAKCAENTIDFFLNAREYNQTGLLNYGNSSNDVTDVIPL